MKRFIGFLFNFLLILFSYKSTASVSWAQACALNVPSGTVSLSNTNVTFCSLSVSAGATLLIQGAVTINVTGNVDIEGVVYGSGCGYGSPYAFNFGPGGGGIAIGGGGGGGGHGGSGGVGGNGISGTGGGTGGAANDNPLNPVLMGSAGGPVNLGLFSAFPYVGGAAFILNAPSGTVSLNGIIDMSGKGLVVLGVSNGVGGGAGGTISISAQNILFNGSLNANGGNAANGGGGGGGGIILLCPTLNSVSGTGTYSVTGGMGGTATGSVSAGNPGSPGFFNACVPSTPTPIPNNETFFISKNTFQPSQGPVSIFLATSEYPGALKLNIYNSAGEYIQTLDDRQITAPYQNSYSWYGTNTKGGNVASGVYLIILTEPAGIKKAKLLLVR